MNSDAVLDGRSAVESRRASAAPQPHRVGAALHEATKRFAKESRARSWWHVVSTFSVLAAAFAGAALAPMWFLRLAASLLAALTMIRAFAIYHDYLHGAVLARSAAARAFFYSYGLLVLTPPRSWRASHNFHHAEVGRIEGSDVGSFELMTTDDWREASWSDRFAYRFARHPATIASAYVTVFIVSICLLPLLRRPTKNWDSALSLLGHGAAITALWLLGGFGTAFFALILPMTVATAIGGFLFYAQHNFPGMRVLPVSEWTRPDASIVSAGHMRVSPAMRWFTGNIGFHHVHHLNPQIPFYRLPQAMAEIPECRNPTITTFRPRDVVGCFRANLWDDSLGRMVRFRDAR